MTLRGFRVFSCNSLHLFWFVGIALIFSGGLSREPAQAARHASKAGISEATLVLSLMAHCIFSIAMSQNSYNPVGFTVNLPIFFTTDFGCGAVLATVGIVLIAVGVYGIYKIILGGYACRVPGIALPLIAL